MLRKLGLALAFSIGTPAFAAWEVRANFTGYTQTPKSFNAQMLDYVVDAPAVKGALGVGFDGLYRPPVFPLRIGLRYESLGWDGSGKGSISGTPVDVTTKLTGSRSMLLVGYDLLPLPIAHLALMAHYAFQQKLRYTMSSKNAGGSTHVDGFTGEMQPGFGAGVEAGLKIGFVVVATEIGYTVFKADRFTLDGDVALDDSKNPIKMDLSGGYWRVSAGVGF